jgi:ribosomal protein S13
MRAPASGLNRRLGRAFAVLLLATACLTGDRTVHGQQLGGGGQQGGGGFGNQQGGQQGGQQGNQQGNQQGGQLGNQQGGQQGGGGNNTTVVSGGNNPAGVLIDAQGVLRAQAFPSQPLSIAQRKAAVEGLPGDLRKKVPLRKVALSRLEQALAKHAADGRGIPDEIEKLVSILSDPKKFKIPVWMLNRRRDKTDGKSFQMVSNVIATKLREDIEALKKVRAHRGLRHYWGVKVRGQHTGTTGRGRVATMAAAAAAKGRD